MSNDEIREQIQFASSIISKWPAWKRNILKHSLEPTNKIPRMVVDNFKEKDKK